MRFYPLHYFQKCLIEICKCSEFMYNKGGEGGVCVYVCVLYLKSV